MARLLMRWLRRRRRPVQATVLTDYPTDARPSGSMPARAEPDPRAERRSKLRRGVLVASLYVVFSGGVVAALFGNGGLLDLVRLHGEMRSLQVQLVEQQARVEELRHKVGALESDPMAKERIAREELGMLKPGEKVFLLPKEESP
jgi:cell division protein FtsB